MRQSPRGVIVTHREYLQPVVSSLSGVFAPTVYIGQPASQDNFPWLSSIALNYEQYIWHDLAFCYEPRVGTGAGGRLMMATQLDSADPNFTSVDEMLNYKGAQTINWWRENRHDCLLYSSDYMKKYFTLSDSTSGSQVQVYNACKFTFAGEASAGVAAFIGGDLYVEYAVEFFNPKRQPIPISAATSELKATGTGSAPGTSTTSNLSSFPVVDSPIVATAAGGLVNLVIPQVGTYIVDVLSTLSALTANTAQFMWQPSDSKNCAINLQSLDKAETVDLTRYVANLIVTTFAPAAIIAYKYVSGTGSWSSAASDLIYRINRADPVINTFSSVSTWYVTPDSVHTELFKQWATKVKSPFVLADEKQRVREQKMRLVRRVPDRPPAAEYSAVQESRSESTESHGSNHSGYDR